jgi:hypothetical protein
MHRRVLAAVAICGLALFGLQLGGVATARTHAQTYGAPATITGSCTVSNGQATCTFTWSGFAGGAPVDFAVDGGSIGSANSDPSGSGSFVGVFDCSSLGNGDHTISATGVLGGPPVTSTFTITGCGAALRAAFTG